MTTRRTDKKCDKAVVGEKLQKALTAAKCNQLTVAWADSAKTSARTAGR